MTFASHNNKTVSWKNKQKVSKSNWYPIMWKITVKKNGLQFEELWEYIKYIKKTMKKKTQ